MPRKKGEYICTFCAKDLGSTTKLKSHINKEHIGYKCKHCEEIFKTHSALGGHINLVHLRPNAMQPTKEQMLRYKDPEAFKLMHKAAMEKREAWRNNVKITEKQEQLILGGILGDAAIRMGNDKSHNARITFVHGIKQYEYCIWKYEQLKDIVKTEPKIKINGGYGDKVITFNTISLPCLTEIYNSTKRNGTTTITEEFLDKITSPLALAIWILDDGSLDKKNIYHISLGDRTQFETELLQTWMELKWGIESTITKSKEYVIHISKKRESLKLKELIAPHIEVDQMKYKIMFTT